MKCHVCGNNEHKDYFLPYPIYRHSDFKIISKTLSLTQCSNSQLVTKIQNNNLPDVREIYNQDEYFKTKPTHYVSFANIQNNEVNSIYDARANFIKNNIQAKNPSILDIGCLDGKMLLALERFFHNPELHGFDINSNISSIFPKKQNFIFWSENLSHVDKKFDAIILANVMQLVPDLNALLENLTNLIKPDGFIFIETVDVSINPYATLYGDQDFYFTKGITENILNVAGFEFQLFNNTWAIRHLTGIAKKSKKKFRNLKKDNTIEENIQYLKKVSRKLERYSTTSKNIVVLGSTANAAFVNEILGEKISAFVDEHPGKVGKIYYNKKIISPSNLTDSDLILIPYKDTGKEIKERMMKQYKGEYIRL